jgi:hypothetical protein
MKFHATIVLEFNAHDVAEAGASGDERTACESQGEGRGRAERAQRPARRRRLDGTAIDRRCAVGGVARRRQSASLAAVGGAGGQARSGLLPTVGAPAAGLCVATLTHVDRARNAEVRLPFVNGERASGHCRSAMLPNPKEVLG